MQKIEVISTLAESKDVIDFLQRRGVVEISEHEQVESMTYLDTAVNVSQIEKMRNTAIAAKRVLDVYAPEKGSLIDSFKPPRQLELKEFLEKEDESDGTLNTCYDILDFDKRITDSKAEIIRLETANEALSVWTELDVPLKAKPTKYTSLLIGAFPDLQSEASVKETLAKTAPDLEAFDVEIVYASDVQTCAAVLCLKSDERKMLDALRSFGFVKPAELTDLTAKEAKEKNIAKIERLNKKIEAYEKKLSSYGDMNSKIDFLIDYLEMKADKYEAFRRVSVTDNIFYLSGYVPEKYAEKTAKQLESKFEAAVNITEPGEDEDVPVLLKNNSFAAPVEGITEMYSLPGKHDIDPNAIMGFFYYVFFGMMFSDAGYGLLMVIATAIVLLKAKPTGEKRKTVLMYLYCGISTMFWGIMFGSFFGDAINIIRVNYLHLPEMRLYVWLNPQGDDLMTTMLYCFLFGIIHLFVGVAIKGYMEWKDGDKFGAIVDTLSIYMAVGGAAPICAGMIISIPPRITNIAKYIALAGVALIILTAGRASKGIFGKLGAGLYALYNTISGYLSDILSYSRLLALGLVTGIIG
ncbi:MAG: V-type ATP synthase subunit I [Eubacterium sp.]|nr:V-type ATP synthase subunit I [Eubacterium sp.]